jgi:peptide-methionine (S)-S-oxide reductase
MRQIKEKKALQKACFGAGCFWHVEAEFRKVKGVVDAAVGFMGGRLENPSYKDVCTHTTGHAEVCLVEFDPDKVSYNELLEAFWKIHDPTQLNRQGVDVGDQYRSVIFYYDKTQRKLAIESMKKEQKKYKQAIVTQVLPATTFYKAEEYHQRYFDKNHVAACGLR